MHIYFLAIGGAGIGPLAQLAHQAGYEVSGSDIRNTSYIDYLKAHGIGDIKIGDSVDLITSAQAEKPIDWLVYSSAVAMEELGQSQLKQASDLGIKCTKRDQFISEFVRQNNLKMIAIAGTHGKTTTTAMIAWLFVSLGQPINYLIAAKVGFGEMAHFDARSPYFIYEADEYDHNFLAYSPYLSIISGVSWDHQEIYPTREDYISAFNQFISQSEHSLIYHSDADYLKGDSSKLLIQEDNNPNIAVIKLKGLYNRRDGWLATCAAARLLNRRPEELLPNINKFSGLSRRMEEIYPNLFSDYAHTTDKIRGAINAASEIAETKGQTLVVIYQPLTNRRQKHMANDYQDCFKGASHVYWLPSYLAREDPKDRLIGPEELITKLNDPSIAEVVEMDQHLLDIIKGHLDENHMVVAMAGGGGGSLDDWLRDNFPAS